MEGGTGGKVEGRLLILCLIDIDKSIHQEESIDTLLLYWYRQAVTHIPIIKEELRT